MQVQQIMTRTVKTCMPETNLADVAWLMWENDCGSIPVVDDQRRLRGMITDRDICMAVATKGRPAQNITAGEVMSQNAYACRPEDDVRTALLSMASHQVRRLPVVNRDNVIQGILSINDVILKAEEPGFPGISCNDVLEALKGICKHRAEVEARAVAAR